MFPRLLQIGHFSLATYGVLVALALIIGLFTVVRFARREGIDPERAWSLGIVCIFAALIGAKLLLVLNEWDFYVHNPSALFSLNFLQQPGVFSGGVVTPLAARLVYWLRHWMSVFNTMDVLPPGLALCHAMCRLGCFAAGSAYR